MQTKFLNWVVLIQFHNLEYVIIIIIIIIITNTPFGECKLNSIRTILVIEND
jgi:hypothetical protein